MYKRVKKAKLGRKASNRKALVKNQIRSLFENDHVVTTSTKAKELRKNAQSLVGKGKNSKDALALRRELKVVLGNDEKLVKKFLEYCKKEVTGVRLVKVGFRKGDNGEKSRVELMGIEKKKAKVTPKLEKEEKKETKAETTQVKGVKPTMKVTEKGIDKKAVVRKTERAKSRSGL